MSHAFTRVRRLASAVSTAAATLTAGRLARRTSSPSSAPSSPSLVETLEDRRLMAANPAQIDLLIAYTPAASTFVGGTNKIQTKINRAVADLNRALANSQINAAVRLVRVMETNFAEPPGALRQPIPEAIRLADAASADFADVRAARTETGADIVHVIENGVGGGGQVGNFSVSQARHLNADLFLHELGHNLGGGHLPGQGAGFGGDYAQASQVVVGADTYNTLIGGRGMDYYSNPNVLFRGVPTGSATSDNARAMNEQSPGVAAALAGTVADASVPLAGLGPVTAVAGQNSITFKVIYYDGGGVNADTLGNANINVTGPGGLNAAATFLGIETTPGNARRAVSAATVNAGVITAVYTIATPGAVGNLGEYAFAVGGTPVSDIAGNAAGAVTSASGNTSPTSGQVPLVLPRLGGNSTGLATELGDLSGKQLRITDWVGTYYNNNIPDPNLYRFSLSSAGTATLSTAGAGVRVQIFQGADDGSFEAAPITRQLAAGNYYIKIFPAYAQTADPASGQFTLNFNASGNAAGQPATGGTITGRSFNDLTNDNIAQEIEVGFADQSVTLTGTDANGAAVNLTTKTTGTFGNYTFNNVPPSNGAGYTLSISRPANVLQKPTAAPGGSATGGATGTTFTGITVTAGATLAAYNFGFGSLPPFRAISGIVWDDSNGRNGIRNQGEPGVAGVTLRLTGNNVAGDPLGETVATTDAEGNFQFNARPSDAAGYTITKVQPIGFVSGTARPGDAGGTAAANNDSISGIVISNANGLGYDFGVVTPAANQPAPIPTPDTTNVPAGGTVTIDILGNDAPVAPVFDLSGGFAGANIAVNGNAAIDGANLRLADAAGQTSSAYFGTEVNVQKFNSSFTFSTTAGADTGDGMTFIIQGGRSTAIGGGGGALGSWQVGKSIAIKFDLYNNTGEGSNSTGIYLNGAFPTNEGSIDLTPSGVDLHNGSPIRVDMTYNGGTLTVTLTDTVSGASNTQNYTVNIPRTVGANTAFVGFTAGTGGAFAAMNVQSWTYAAATTPAPAPQVALPAGAPTLMRFEVQAEDGETLFADCTTVPAHAKDFQFNSDGTITYTPEDGFVGTDSFQYLLVDAETGRCSDSHATVTFNVVETNSPPELSTETTPSAFTAAGRAVAIDLREYVTDDSTPVDDLKFAVKKLAGNAGGKAKLLSDRHTVLFAPKAGFTGATGFTFIATDAEKAKSEPITFNVTVGNTAQALTAGDTVVTARPGKTARINVPKSAGRDKTITIASVVTPPASGTATIDPAGRFLLYTPDTAAAGTRQSIVVLLQDGEGNTAEANVIVNVLG